MDKTIKVITRENALPNINELVYGSNYISYDIDTTRDYVNIVIETINDIVGFILISERPIYREYMNGNVFDQEISNEGFNLVRTSDSDSIPELTNDDINYREIIAECAKQKCVREVYLNRALIKKAKKECFNYGVRFRNGLDFQMIDGREKKESVYRKLESAYRSGATSISFSDNEIFMPTLRTYTSQLGTVAGKKFRCAVGGGKATVYFKEPSKRDVVKGVFKSTIEQHMSDLGIYDITEIYHEVMNEMFPEEMKDNRDMDEPEWKKSGYESEEAYEDYWRIDKPDPESEEDDDF